MNSLTYRSTTLLAGLVAASCGDDTGGPGADGPAGAADTYAITSDGKVIAFDRSSPGTVATEVAIRDLAAGETVLGADIRPADGLLYGLTSAGRIVTIDPGSGAIAQKSVLAADPGDATMPFTELAGTDFGIDFNPVVDRLRVVSTAGSNLRINVDSGATTTDGALAIDGVAATGVSAAAYSSNFAAACRTALYYLDSAGDRLLATSDPNAGALVEQGALGIDVDAVGGFEIITDPSGAASAIGALSAGGATALYSIDLASGAASAIGPLTSRVVAVTAAPPATAPVQGAGELLGLTVGDKLVSFNRAAPAKLCTSAAISGLAPSERALGIAVRPANGKLYAVTSAARIVTIDPATGAATAGATLAADPADPSPGNAAFSMLRGTSFGVDFNPVPDRLRIVSDAGQNLRINADSGLTITDLDTTSSGAARAGIMAAAYTDAIGGGNAASQTTALFYVDAMADALATTSAPNDGVVTAVGPGLGIAIGAIGSFDIDGRTNTALLAAQLDGATTTTLHTVDLDTGVASASIGTVGGGEALRGLARTKVPTASVFAVTVDGDLIRFAPSAPGTTRVVGRISGLAAGEVVTGIDVRPANDKLYGLTSTGRVLTIDVVTAAATPSPALAAAAGDDNPFTSLSGVEFGIDFNPVPDRLRVVSDAGQSLRINVATATATTDSNLSSAVADVFGAAYSNNFTSPPATALYALDAFGNSLVLIGASPATGGACPADAGNPNCGVVAVRGQLTVNVSAIGDMDIAGGANGFALAALQLAAGGSSSLYRINLATGAATAIGPIGAAGAAPVRGIAIRLE